MEFKRREKNENFTIDIAPLVDVVFLLLIFFMLSTTFEINPGLKVNLPESSSKEIQKQKKEIKIVVTKTGSIYYNGRPVDLNKLNNRFKNLKDKKTLVIIEADRFSFYGNVVSVMDIAKQNGLNNFAIATKQKK
jgi:biopolymer transport protein ExbD